MDRCGGAEVLAAGHKGHALEGVIVGDAEMVAGGRALAPEDDVADGSGIAVQAAMARFVK